MFCNNCDKQINDEAKFCNHCGVEITRKEASSGKKFCPFCKKEIDLDYENCPNCGRLLIEKLPFSTAKFSSHEEENVYSDPKKSFIERINYSKIVKYSLILLIILFVAWVFSGDEQSYNGESQIEESQIEESQIEESQIETNKPADIERKYNSLPNGTIINSLPYYLSGDGELEINNGTGYDTVVKLIHISTDRAVYTAYIKANNIHKIGNIRDGNYKLLFMHGKDWDGIYQTFLVSKSYSEFRDDFYFITTWEEYTIYEVTLHPVLGGTAITDEISENEFDKYN